MLWCRIAWVMLVMHLEAIQGRTHPKVEIAYPRLLEARGHRSDKVLHINDDIVLELEKTSVLSESFVFSDESGDHPVETLMNGTFLERNLYYDKQKKAAVEVKETNGRLEVRGILGENLRILPIPFMTRAEDGTTAHKLFEVEPSADYENDYIESNYNKLEERDSNTSRAHSAKPKNVPNPFLVEVMLVSDKYHYKHFSTDEALILYFCTVMAMVNIRYSESSKPNVQFLLVKITKDPGIGFLRHIYGSGSEFYTHSEETLPLFARKYKDALADLVLHVTGLELADYDDDFEISTTKKGMAYVGGLCSENRRFGHVEDVAETFSMTTRAAHEIGHILGMVHDGQTPSRSVPGVKWQTCEARKGYLMAPFEGGDMEGFFSNCSLQQLKVFISQQTEDCFTVKSKVSLKSPEQLPGVNLTMNDLCKKLHPQVSGLRGYNFTRYTQRCQFLCCPKGKNVTCFLERFVDGMPCGNKKICFRAKCVERNTGLPPLPTLAEHTTTLSRKDAESGDDYESTHLSHVTTSEGRA